MISVCNHQWWLIIGRLESGRQTSLEAIGKVKVQKDNGPSYDQGMEEETTLKELSEMESMDWVTDLVMEEFREFLV